MKKRIAGQEGAAAVEFAFVLPLLLVVVFGIIEFSILVYDKAMITNASRVGARYGIVYDFDSSDDSTHPSEDEIKAKIDQYLQNYLISFGAGSHNSDVDGEEGNSGDPLTVTVTYQFDFLVFSNLLSLLGGSMADGIPLSAVTVMRLE